MFKKPESKNQMRQKMAQSQTEIQMKDMIGWELNVFISRSFD